MLSLSSAIEVVQHNKMHITRMANILMAFLRSVAADPMGLFAAAGFEAVSFAENFAFAGLEAGIAADLFGDRLALILPFCSLQTL
jgi:hypothetical protein